MDDTSPPNALAAAVVAAGIDLVACLPDSWLSPALDTLDADDGVEIVRVAREDDGLGICAGAWLGGRRATCWPG
jgi:sulfopyruvate decarboxylase subunit alpha